jgi:hypothetical protein
MFRGAMGMIVDSGSYLIAGFKLIFVHQQPCCSNSVALKVQSQSLAKRSAHGCFFSSGKSASKMTIKVLCPDLWEQWGKNGHKSAAQTVSVERKYCTLIWGR